MRTTIGGRYLEAAIAAALLAGGCQGGASTIPIGGACSDPVLRVPLPAGDAGAPDGGDAGVAPFPTSGPVPLDTCMDYCPEHATTPSGWPTQLSRCAPVADDGGAQVECRYTISCPGGRAAEGDAAFAPADASPGALLAAMASLEAASVGAFARLARELRAHGAPRALRRSARCAASDERRHARAMASLAQRYGARPSKARGPRRGARDLESVALENAVEGCVRETWGALAASWQARRAGDARVRGALAAIARDETRHAALAWGVARWAEARLTPEARTRVEGARRAAVVALCDEAARAPRLDDAAGAVGWPRASEASAMLAVLRARVWDA